MGFQEAFNLAVGVAGVFGGWMLRMIYDRITELQNTDVRLANSVEDVKDHYVRRDDFKDFVSVIHESLDRIEAKLDGKVDK